MKTIKELITKKEHTWELQAPDMNSQNAIDTVHILFFSPKLNANGYYRMLLPYLELAKTPLFKTHLIGLTKEDFNTPFELSKIPLLDDWILWADYIVFPIITNDFRYFFQACKVINPQLQIVIDICVVLHQLSRRDPLYKKVTNEMLTAFADNLNSIDIITAPNEHILEFYQQFLKTAYGNSRTFFAHLPNLLSMIGYRELDTGTPTKNEKVRVGMLVDPRYAQDLELLLVPLQRIQETYKDTVTLIVFGWNGVMSDGSKPLHQLAIEYHTAVPITEHLKKLAELNLDIALLAMQNKASRRFVSDAHYLELASFGIPVIASKHSIFSNYILDGKTGSLANGTAEWQQAIEKHIEDTSYRKELGETAKALFWDAYSYSEENLEQFTALFF